MDNALTSGKSSSGNIEDRLHKLRRRISVSSSNCRGLNYVFSYLSFLLDFYQFRRQIRFSDNRFPTLWKDRLVCLHDRTETPTFDRHYVFHSAWAARILARTEPKEHVDIASSLYFVTTVSAFYRVRFYDYRPVDLNLEGLQSQAADVLDLPFPDLSIHSLSCMHVVEHIGLGRYGEPIDPAGDLKAIAELKRVLAANGNLIFVVPVGRPRIVFNAHRIYSYGQIIRYFSELKLEEFALIPDDPEEGGIIYHAVEALADAQQYGCGCFWFRK